MSALAALMLAQVAATACDPSTEIVSEARCQRYGQMWSTEKTWRVVVGAGFFSGSFATDGRDFSIKRAEDKATSGSRYSGDRLQLGTVRTYGFDFDIHGFVSEHAYLGFDLAIGMGHAGASAPIDADGYRFGPSSGVDVFHGRMGGLFGIRAPAKYVSVRLEALVGFQVISISHQAVPLTGGAAERGESTNVTFLFEPRVAVDLWTAPWATVSGWVGKDVMHLRDTSGGIMFSLHGRSFDGGL